MDNSDFKRFKDTLPKENCDYCGKEFLELIMVEKLINTENTLEHFFFCDKCDEILQEKFAKEILNLPHYEKNLEKRDKKDIPKV